ncbi:MAG TPA: TraR/DksA C4-type zinc finger protein [Acidimicrobiales bacterium]|nr:TraR/DksA C4-type zinc finger protein [Acidimicrobiales bacterium]
MLSSDELSTLRDSLEEAEAGLRRQLAELGADAFDENFADSGQVAAEQGEHRVLAGALSDQLEEVVRALGKIEAGTYGACEVGGEPIPLTRLEAVPTARSCIDHT